MPAWVPRRMTPRAGRRRWDPAALRHGLAIGLALSTMATLLVLPLILIFTEALSKDSFRFKQRKKKSKSG